MHENYVCNCDDITPKSLWMSIARETKGNCPKTDTLFRFVNDHTSATYIIRIQKWWYTIYQWNTYKLDSMNYTLLHMNTYIYITIYIYYIYTCILYTEIDIYIYICIYIYIYVCIYVLIMHSLTYLYIHFVSTFPCRATARAVGSAARISTRRSRTPRRGLPWAAGRSVGKSAGDFLILWVKYSWKLLTTMN